MSSTAWLDWELTQLVSDFSERNREIALKRWGYYTQSQPTLESIGQVYGISRERVRQIVRRIERQLKEDDAKLSSASQVIRAVDDRGGAIPTEELLSDLKDARIVAGEGALRVVASLSSAGIVSGELSYSNKFELWFTAKGEAQLSGDGQLATVRRDIRDVILTSLRTVGVISLSALDDDSPFSPEHSVDMAATDRGPFDAVLNHMVPRRPNDSKLTRRAERIIAVSEDLLLSTVVDGINRSLDTNLPPPAVVRSLLDYHDSFAVVGRRVRRGSEHPGIDCLSSGHKKAVSILRDNGGVIRSTDFTKEMISAGYSRPMASAILGRAPYIANPAYGVYTLRGSDVSQHQIQTYLEERQSERKDYLLSVNRVAPTIVHARFRINRVVLNGALNVPSEINAQKEDWKGRFPDGRTIPLTLRNNFLWSFREWLKEKSADVDDIIAATFHLDEHIVELDLVEPGGNNE